MAWLARRLTTPTQLMLVTLLLFAVVLGCAITTGELLELAERPDGSTPFDSSITPWVVAHRTAGLTAAARLFSTLGSQAILIPVTAIVTLALVGRRRFVHAGLLVVAWGGAIGLYSLTKHFVQRLRPPMDIWLTNVGRTSSFPSGHATQSLATFVALVLIGAVLLPWARWPGRAIALVLVIGVGWSRVYLGVHWPTDVLAGWLAAAAWIAIVVLLAKTAHANRATAAQRD
jgi:membrane-associated phospholipid phosphatase